MEATERAEMVRAEAAFAADAVISLTKALRASGNLDTATFDHIHQLLLQHLNIGKGRFVDARAHALEKRLMEDVRAA